VVRLCVALVLASIFVGVGTRIPDDPEPVALVRCANVGSGDSRPLRIEPEGGKVL
jgi:hypothetical protein